MTHQLGLIDLLNKLVKASLVERGSKEYPISDPLLAYDIEKELLKE